MKINDITKKIAGVEKSRDASDDMRQEMKEKGLEVMNYDPEEGQRYIICSDCKELKEEFKLFGVTIKDKTPACKECGCSLYAKIPLGDVFSCPLGLW